MTYVLTIKERNSSWAGRSAVSSFHPSLDAAKAELLDYVRRNWKGEMETDPPKDPDEMVREYFDEVLEAYEISESAE